LVVGNHDGSQEAVVDGVTGYIVDPYDLSKQASILLNLATDSELLERMGIAARKRAEADFAYPEFRKKHEELFGRWFSYAFSSKMLDTPAQKR
jgi:phosphatidyl-myo-inositol dimannoside synthase